MIMIIFRLATGTGTGTRKLSRGHAERENYHVGMRSLIILLSNRKLFLSI